MSSLISPDLSSMKRLLLVLLGLLAWVPCVVAQETGTPALRTLPPQAQARVVTTDTLFNFRTRPVPGGRLDLDEGVLRAAYRIGTRVAPAASPDEAARAYLAAAAPQFGWAPEAGDLVLQRAEPVAQSTHLTFQQTFFGVPVFQRQVKVNLDKTGQPTFVLSGYAPHLKNITTFDPQPGLSEAAARSRAAEAVSSVGARTSAPELVVYPSKQPLLAWRVVAWPEDAVAEWEVLLDAHTGELIQLFDLTTHARREPERRSRGVGEEAAGMENASPKTSALSPSLRRSSSAVVQGSGLVFDPDPLTTAGVSYGPPYVDADDQDISELNAQRVEVMLNDITQGGDGLYRLEGPYVRVAGSTAGFLYTPPALDDPNGFRFTRSDNHFEAVMVYYHIDRSQRYLRALDLGRDVQNGAIVAEPHGLGTADNSKFFVESNKLAFGDGGIDDAEDADVIWHEYGHALLEAGAPGLLRSNEGVAFHEGWADYWAASYSRHLVETGKVPAGDWRKVFSWDGNQFWDGRRLDAQAHYPEGLSGQVHTDGLLWATTLMQVYDDLGREVTDRLALLSHAYLSPPIRLSDAAEAVIQADLDHYGGAHLGVLLQHFGARGFVDPSVFGPALAHEPVGYVEQTGATVTFEVTVTPAAAPISAVTLFYRADGEAFQEVTLAAQGDDRYAASLVLPGEAARIDYYLRATDASGGQAVLPTGAPGFTYSFGVGPDTEAPEITHTPVAQAAPSAWPIPLVATVEDNQGIAEVWASYAIEDGSGQVVSEGTFALSAGEEAFEGRFPNETVALGYTVHYRLHARDVAATPNETVVPATGDFSFAVVAEGVLAAFDFEERQGTASGAFAHGAPAYTLRTAHSGANVWATGLRGPYPGIAGRASLELPSVNLAGFDEAYLIFWHWYDIEHDGAVEPGTGLGGTLWDGANVKVSTDGGTTWTVLQPEDGYDAAIDGDFGNPMGGESAWGGYSRGWQRVVAPLPQAGDVRLRFDFGTDDSNEANALAFAGWHLDDVMIATVRPVDATPPTVAEVPPPVVVRGAGQAPPPLEVRVTDNTGVASVVADYEIIREAGTTAGTLRLPMRLDDLTTFAAAIPEGGYFDTSDRIEYRLTLRDPDGNETVYPPAHTAPLRIDYHPAERTPLLDGVQASGDWEAVGEAWSAAQGAAEAVSSLTLSPIDLPVDAGTIHLLLDHRYVLGNGTGGNVKISTDGGATWSLLHPEGGYPATLATDSHPMKGEAVFGGALNTRTQATFDLTALEGRQVRLRIDLGAARSLSGSESWSIYDAVLSVLDTGTDTDDVQGPLALALHPNYPDPFADRTTITYTLAEPGPVSLTLYNLLGQRIIVLDDSDRPAGTHMLTMQRDHLAAGVYFLRLVVGDKQFTEQLVIAH